MATEENNKKKPVRGERYRNLYDAYRNETESDDDEFWSSLKADRSSAGKSAGRVSTGSVRPERSETPTREREIPTRERAITRSSTGKDISGPDRPGDPDNGGATPPRGGRPNRGNSKRKKDAERKKLIRGRRIFIVFLVLWSIFLIGVGIWLWRYTGRCLKDYEKSQPENNANRLLEEFVTKVRDGSIEGEFKEFKESTDWKLQGEFQDEDLVKNEYLDRLKAVQTFSCIKNENSYSTTNPVYDILDDQGKAIARMTMTSYNPRKILAILEVCEWKISSVSAVINKNYSTKDYTYTVPENYTITVNGKPLTREHVIAESEYPKELEYVRDYVPIPLDLTYKVSNLVYQPEVVVTDENGENVAVTPDENGCFSITYAPQKGLEAPQDRYNLALETAKKWMDFVTNDLKGSNRGLAEIRTYLLKHSLFYDKAEEYAKGPDIRFVSDHTIMNPEYTELEVKDYCEFTDNCFSIHIHFVKNMKLVKGGSKVTSVMDSTLYFVYCDDTDDGKDNPRWTLGDMLASAKQNYGVDEE